MPVPVPPLAEPVPLLEPAPMPVEDPPVVPEPTPVAGAAGLVVEEPGKLPVAPVPAEPARLSCRHFSRSAPVSATHLLGTSVDAPVDADPVEPLDMEPLEPVAPLVPVEPLVPPAEAPPTLEPEVPLAPVEPDGEPEDCANVTDERASSAAAVAAVKVFNIMIGSPRKGLDER